MSTAQFEADKSQLMTVLYFGFRLWGWGGILVGIVQLVFIAVDNFAYAAIRLGDAFVTMLLGAMGLACWKLLIRAKREVIAVWSGVVAVALIYSLAMGRGFDMRSAIFGAAVLVGLVVLWRRQELS